MSRPGPAGDAPPDDDSPPARAEALRAYFDGNQALYDAFRAGCVRRFADELHKGDAAAAEAELPALRLQAHSLKTVLRLIGCPALAELAAQIEHLAESADAAALPLWPHLSDGVRRIEG